MILNETFTLSNGVKIPKIGLGTWQIPDGEDTYNSVMFALKNGYRHIDTAKAYGNEASVGKAVRDFGIAREEVFITTKLPAECKGYEIAKKCFEESLSDLGLGYIDLYLIHAPWPWDKMGMDGQYLPGFAETAHFVLNARCVVIYSKREHILSFKENG